MRATRLNPDGPIHSVLSASLVIDNLNEDGPPDAQVHLDNLDEAAIEAWWDNFQKTNPKFRGLHNNCSTVLAQALDVGGGPKHTPDLGRPMVWTPDDILEYARQLQLAGGGVYVPKPPPPWAYPQGPH